MEKKILIVYYSWSGNTEKAAGDIQVVTGGRLCEITPEIPYPVSYHETVEQGKKEIRRGERPVVRAEVSDISSYDIIFIGSPNWWSTIAPPVSAFAEMRDFTGKTVVPFFTHGGGGGGRMLEEVRHICDGADLKEPLVIYNRGNSGLLQEIRRWVEQLQI